MSLKTAVHMFVISARMTKMERIGKGAPSVIASCVWHVLKRRAMGTVGVGNHGIVKSVPTAVNLRVVMLAALRGCVEKENARQK